MENGMSFGTCLWHIATAFWGQKIEIIEREAGRNAVPTFGPDLVMDDTH
jgi:hypothetical protein